MADIFISYASPDLERAQALAAALERKGWSVWWHGPVLTGEIFADLIQEELAAARCVIALWSERSVRSDWVIETSEQGKSRGILVSALIDDVEIPSGFEETPTQRLVEWVRDPGAPGFDRLANAVNTVLADVREEADTRAAEPQVDDAESVQPQSTKPITGAAKAVYASHTRRLFAFLLDSALVVLFHLTAGGGRWHLTAAFFALYHTLSLVFLGRSLGKGAMGLVVRRHAELPDDRRLVWWAAFLRSTIGYLASAFLLLGFLNALRDERRRGWHDEMFGSEVVQRPGALSIKRVLKAIDKWTEELDAWQKRVLSRFKRLRGLAGLALKLTGLMTLLQSWLERVALLVMRLFRIARPEAAAPAGQSGAAAMASASGVTAITSTITAVTLAASTVAAYEATREVSDWALGLPPPIELGSDRLGTGDVQLTLSWEGPADIDLHVTDPAGHVIRHDSRASPSGGRLDVDAHAECNDISAPGMENIFWGQGTAPAGAYEVRVHYFLPCENSGTTRWRVDLKVDGKSEVFRGKLEPGSDAYLVTTLRRGG